MNIRLLGNNEENYLTIDLAKASLFLFLEMVLLGFIFCTATQKNALIQILIDILTYKHKTLRRSQTDLTIKRSEKMRKTSQLREVRKTDLTIERSEEWSSWE